ncbi:DNA polymerase III, beta subunit [Ammonifex degensii KC4]|uniref:Beta sliding clamp n=1 Tax=Ammonifex degensii (strain DSM 10501 / KC4) TaxID=429009 RepID=C9RC59_AMMDK|nr:DNA polymerase III subunit beta [Ammonifex degensii]ACX51836.1 DNA polymerase III, beta subunit [Ammonifex degensii KC4]
METVKTGLRVVVKKEELEKVLNICLRCVPSKPLMPQLGGVLVRGKFRENGSPAVTVTATDLDAQIVASLQAHLEGEGELWLPAKETFDLVRRLPECTLELGQAGPEQVLVSYPGGEARLTGMNPEEFPAVNEQEDGYTALPGEGLTNALRRVLYAAAPDGPYTAITGVEISRSPSGGLTFAATDGHRLAVFGDREEDGEGSQEDRKSWVVPAGYLREVLVLAKLLGKEPDRVLLGRHTASFVWPGEAEFTCRLIDYKFPDWRQALPRESPATSLTTTVNTLLPCLERAKTIARANSVPVVLLVKEGEEVRLEARSEAGEFKERVDGRAEGEDVTVAFNAGYLLEALKVLDSAAEVRVGLYGPASPATVTVPGDERYLALVLPVRLV